jgi:tetratricopeptide (TPR) repeat protein
LALGDHSLRVTEDRWFISGVAITMALCGESERAERLIEELVTRHPSETLVSTEARPVVLAIGALYRGDAAAALELVRPAARYERGLYAALWPAYVRGLALLELERWDAATDALDGIAASEGILALARFAPPRGIVLLGAARARARNGDYDGARVVYQQLLELWRDADPDLAALAEARNELELLGSLPAPMTGDGQRPTVLDRARAGQPTNG